MLIHPKIIGVQWTLSNNRAGAHA